MPPASHPERDEEIAYLIEDPDVDIIEVARQYGLSTTRIGQIAREYGVRTHQRVRTWYCRVCERWISPNLKHAHKVHVSGPRGYIKIPPEIMAKLRVLREEDGYSWTALGHIAIEQFGLPYKNFNAAQAALYQRMSDYYLDRRGRRTRKLPKSG